MDAAPKRPDPLTRWLLFALLVGYAYVASLAVRPYPFSFALKAIPALTLCGLALVRLDGRARVNMALAFAFAAAGDVFLDLDRTRYLPHGLACFLVTQVGFALAFAGHARWTPARLPVIALFVIAAVVLLVFAWPSLGALTIPVIVYIGALLAMTSTALMAVERPWIARGAIAFLISDALIGINRFVAPFAGSTAVIVAIYVTAIVMIARGVFGPPREA